MRSKFFWRGRAGASQQPASNYFSNQRNDRFCSEAGAAKADWSGFWASRFSAAGGDGSSGGREATAVNMEFQEVPGTGAMCMQCGKMVKTDVDWNGTGEQPAAVRKVRRRATGKQQANSKPKSGTLHLQFKRTILAPVRATDGASATGDDLRRTRALLFHPATGPSSRAGPLRLFVNQATLQV